MLQFTISRKYLAVVLCALLVILTGCDDKVRKAAQAAKDFSVASRTFQNLEIGAHQKGFVDDAEHRTVQTLLIDVARAGKELDQAINVAHSQPKAMISLQAALDTTDHLLNEGVLHIKDADTRTNFQLLLVSMRGLLATVSAVLETK